MENTTTSPLGKFKTKEAEYRFVLPKKSIIGMRLDGKAFHTFTKQFERPYDFRFMDTMDATALHLAGKVVSGCMFGYVQSDEITIFFSDLFGAKNDTHMFNAGKVEKILSTTASAATGAFLKALPEVDGIPVFDCRLFVLDDLDEVQEYMDWRRLDARKNSISMASEMLHGYKELMKVNTKGRMDLLRGTEYEILPGGFFEGRIITKSHRIEDVTYFNRKTGETKTTTARRSFWEASPATREATEAEVSKFRPLLETTNRGTQE